MDMLSNKEVELMRKIRRDVEKIPPFPAMGPKPRPRRRSAS